MLGMGYVINTRRGGYRPAHVVISRDRYEADTTPNWLQIQPSDSPETIDLRPLVGLFVTVMGEERREVDRWVDALKRAEAATVVSCVGDEWTWHRLNGADQ